MNLSPLTQDQLDALWAKAHRRKYLLPGNHTRRAARIQDRIFREETRRREDHRNSLKTH